MIMIITTIGIAVSKCNDIQVLV